MTPVEITSNESHGTCPCCGAELVLHGVQRYPAALNRPDKNLVHCVNKTDSFKCELYMATTSDINATWEQWGKPVQK